MFILFINTHVLSLKIFKCIPIAAYYLPQNAGDLARKYIKDPRLLSFIDAEVSLENWFSKDFCWRLSIVYLETIGLLFPTPYVSPDISLCVVILQCFIVSTVNALQTPMINAAMVRLNELVVDLFLQSVSIHWMLFASGFMW